MSGGRVYNQPIRDAIQEWMLKSDSNTWSNLALKMGFAKGGTVRIKRALGLLESASYKDGQRYTYFSKNIDESKALAFIEAIGRAPHEFDL